MTSLCFAGALVLALAGGGQAGGAAAPDAQVVARAGTVTLTDAELNDAIREARASGDTRRMLATLSADGRERMALDLLERKTLAEAGRSAGVDREPAVQRALAIAADTVVAHALVNQGIAALDLSEAGLRRFYDANQSRFRLLPRRRAHHVVVASRGEAEAALAAIRGGARIEDVAAARNTDKTRTAGGDLGWVAKGVMVSAFDDALFALTSPGQVSGIVKTSFGFHIIRVDEVDPGQLPAFDVIRDRVRQAIVEDLRQQLKRDLERQYPVTVDRGVLAAIGK